VSTVDPHWAGESGRTIPIDAEHGVDSYARGHHRERPARVSIHECMCCSAMLCSAGKVVGEAAGREACENCDRQGNNGLGYPSPSS
jgi:hypothetical protein